MGPSNDTGYTYIATPDFVSGKVNEMSLSFKWDANFAVKTFISALSNFFYGRMKPAVNASCTLPLKKALASCSGALWL